MPFRAKFQLIEIHKEGLLKIGKGCYRFWLQAF